MGTDNNNDTKDSICTDSKKGKKKYSYIPLWEDITRGKYAGMGAANIGSTIATIPDAGTRALLGGTSFGAWNLFDALQSVIDCIITVSILDEHSKKNANTVKANNNSCAEEMRRLRWKMILSILGVVFSVAVGVMTSLKYVQDTTGVFSCILHASKNFQIAAQGLFSVSILLGAMIDVVTLVSALKNKDVADQVLATSNLVLSIVSFSASVFSVIGLTPIPGVAPYFAIIGSVMHMIAASGKQMLAAADDNVSSKNKALLNGDIKKIKNQKYISAVCGGAQVALQISSAVILYALASTGLGLSAVIPVIAVSFGLMIVLSIVKNICERKWGNLSAISITSGAVKGDAVQTTTTQPQPPNHPT